MKEAIDFIANLDVGRLAADPKVLVAVAALTVVAALMRWKLVVLLLFGLCGIVAVARYAQLGDAVLDTRMYLFIGGALAVAFVIIYFLFIKGD